MTISLEHIQTTLKTLWLDRESFTAFFNSEGAAGESDDVILFREGADREGIELYGQLLRYGWHEVMSSIYPLCEQILAADWEATVDDYFKRYPPRHYNLNRLAARFAEYLQCHEYGQTEKLPWMAELADFEWLELEVLEHPGRVPKASSEPLATVEHFQGWAPVLNPTLCTRAYKYAVMEIADAVERGESVDDRLSEPKESFVAGFRRRQTNGCNIVSISELTHLILQKSQQKVSSYAELASLTIRMCDGMSPEDAALDFINHVENMHEMSLLVGHNCL